MNSVVKKETLSIAKGTIILVAVSIGISALIGKLDFPLLLGFLIGGTHAIINFYLIGRSIEKSFEKSPNNASGYMAGQYFIRYFITALVILLGIYVDFINYIGIIIPLIFPKLVLLYSKIFRKEAN
ncbi:MAG: ATP synthase subunit I [Oscillospiraceae bacterium]